MNLIFKLIFVALRPWSFPLLFKDLPNVSYFLSLRNDTVRLDVNTFDPVIRIRILARVNAAQCSLFYLTHVA